MTSTTYLRDNRNVRSMNSPLEFWDTVRLECDRADRYDMRLSMVVYEIGVKHEQSLLVRTLSRRLAKRVRNMDFIGWFSTGQLGVLMPHTPNDGATRLAQDVYELLLPLTSPPPFTVYTYPSTLWPIKKSVPLRLLKIIKNIRSILYRTGITEAGELRSQLGMELDRANRYGHTFALLVFHRQCFMTLGINLFNLAKALNNRLRETDTFGWYGPDDIAVILPYSDQAAATMIGEEICEIVGIPVSGSFTAYAYPNQWMTPSTEITAARRFSETLRPEQQPLPLRNKEEFNAILNAEVAQAKDNDHPVSLLIFNSNHLKIKNGSVMSVVRSIDNRLKEFNKLGWYEEENIGVVLPYISHESATKLGHSICKSNQLAVQETMSVNTYPDHWFQAPLNCPSAPERAESPSPEGVRHQDSTSQHSPVEIYDLLAHPLPTWKRTLDIMGALCGILLLSPLFAAAAIGIRISSPGPIIFRQTRIGFKKEPFKLLKFRSMHAHVEAEKHRKFMKELISANKNRPNTKMANDERIFPFGAFLRKACIDELPQLFNVLKGEMSLVGPRPCLDYEADEYLHWHTRRFCIVPGVTGLWQVSGKNRLSFEQMIRLDILYAKKISLWMDLKIIFKTFPTVVSIYLEKHI